MRFASFKSRGESLLSGRRDKPAGGRLCPGLVIASEGTGGQFMDGDQATLPQGYTLLGGCLLEP
ncbi:hypothetical protein CH063_11279 [Colletotrichum higginsianum]|uniref:Uncharacterized protein n=1 Tax=Colletotrichum higginsianum (strain IMI 349063) TaxID=759273 RepID=H1VKQ6_COLHI|nr:hypothetical protein CH063_11279 [Colletotrichum higginsianum]